MVCLLVLTGCKFRLPDITSFTESLTEQETESHTMSSTGTIDNSSDSEAQKYDKLSYPQYSGSPVIIINGNEPLFTDKEKQNVVSFET